MSTVADRTTAPRAELQDILPPQIRELLGENGSFQTEAESKTGFDKINEDNLKVGIDDTTVAYTAGAQERDKEKLSAKFIARAGQQNIARVVSTSLNINPIDLTGINLWDEERVAITEEGTLQIADEDGQFRDATITEQVELEENSGACSVAVTAEEIEMNEFMRNLHDGIETDVPEALQQLAEERGIENPTYADYETLIRETYPPHISIRIMSEGPASELLAPLDLSDFQAEPAPAALSGATVAGADGFGISSPVALQTPWNNAAPLQSPAPAPGYTPVPQNPGYETNLTLNTLAPAPPAGMGG